MNGGTRYLSRAAGTLTESRPITHRTVLACDSIRRRESHWINRYLHHRCSHRTCLYPPLLDTPIVINGTRTGRHTIQRATGNRGDLRKPSSTAHTVSRNNSNSPRYSRTGWSLATPCSKAPTPALPPRISLSRAKACPSASTRTPP